MRNKLHRHLLRFLSTAREISLASLNWLIPRLEALWLRLQAELGYVSTEERWERDTDADRYYRDPDR